MSLICVFDVDDGGLVFSGHECANSGLNSAYEFLTAFIIIKNLEFDVFSWLEDELKDKRLTKSRV